MNYFIFKILTEFKKHAQYIFILDMNNSKPPRTLVKIIVFNLLNLKILFKTLSFFI